MHQAGPWRAFLWFLSCGERRLAERIIKPDGDQAPSPSPSVPRLKPRAYLRGFLFFAMTEGDAGMAVNRHFDGPGRREAAGAG
jgi:hypothetical protein